MLNTKTWNSFEETERMKNKKHSIPSDEYNFYDAVASGDVELIEENCAKKEFMNPKGKGCLSPDHLRNVKYHFVITAALTTRFCTDAGMENEEAYTLSDFYILKMDECQSVLEVSDLHDEMVLDFTKRMRLIKRPASLSKPVLKCVNFIYENLTDRISIEDLAKVSNLSATYLPRLFKSEMGVAPADYIRERKILYAKQLLKDSNYSITQIADMLSFSSQSHFVQVFKKSTGTTPKKFREQKSVMRETLK